MATNTARGNRRCCSSFEFLVEVEVEVAVRGLLFEATNISCGFSHAARPVRTRRVLTHPPRVSALRPFGRPTGGERPLSSGCQAEARSTSIFISPSVSWHLLAMATVKPPQRATVSVVTLLPSSLLGSIIRRLYRIWSVACRRATRSSPPSLGSGLDSGAKTKSKMDLIQFSIPVSRVVRGHDGSLINHRICATASESRAQKELQIFF